MAELVDATDLIKTLTPPPTGGVRGVFVRILRRIPLEAVIRRLIILSTTLMNRNIQQIYF